MPRLGDAVTQWGLDTLFNPSKRHMDEEKNRLHSTREEVGDNSGGRRVDLDAGKVVIARDAATDGDSHSSKIDDDELTPAQRRARERQAKARAARAGRTAKK